MEGVTGKFDKGKNAILVENNAQTIYDHLNELEKDNKVYSKRWFWELLQNAKDSVGNNRKVSVKVHLEKNELTFLHTGDPFENADILHLIFHGSSKKSLEGKTGRFGTGFMSTHLLSRKVKITGKLADNTFFQFLLNREADTVTQQQENLETSYTRFCESNRKEKYVDEPFNSVFSYSLSESTLKTAQDGINQLQKILPFVMAFNNKIENIEINNNGDISSVRKGSTSEIEFDQNKIVIQEVLYDTHTYSVIFVNTNDFDTAVLLRTQDTYDGIVDLDESYPRLFFDFPLFGTEKLGCPAVINSNKFDLKAERDGIFLGEDDKDKPTILENKRLLTAALGCLSVLVKYIAEKQASGLFNLFKLVSPFDYSWLHKQWLEGIYINQISLLLESDCLIIHNKPLKLNKIVVPFSKSLDRQSFYKLVTQLIADSSPQISEATHWIAVAEGFSKLENKEIVEYDFIITKNKVCKLIEGMSNLDKIDETLSQGLKEESQTPIDALTWLNNFYSLLSKEQFEHLSSHYAIIPNQRKKLVKKELSTPLIDRIGNESIKTVVKQFQWDIQSDLIYPKVIIKEGIFQTCTLEKTLAYISNEADKITDEQLSDATTRKAIISHLKWSIDNKQNSLLKDLFVIVEKGRESTQVSFSKRRLFQTNSDKLLAPAAIWSANFSIYKELIPRKFVLIDEYNNQLSVNDLSLLDSLQLIFISPLVSRTDPSKNDLKLLVKPPELYSKLLNEEDEILITDIEYSDIAYLTRSDDNILNKTADSIRSAKLLLKFLLSQVLEKDANFNKWTEITISNEFIRLNKCLWICRLKETQWIPVKAEEGEKPGSERPSVANISELIKDEPDILNILNSKNAALFFNLLGISVADIMRSSLPSEEERLRWDMTFSQLLTNGGIDPDLAVEMLSDPKLQETYLKNKADREQIQKNQKIGYLFEKIFREIFESEEYKALGFSIKRTAIGSDFGLSYSTETVIKEQDVLNDSGQETIFQVGKTLIELKATGKAIAEMTPLQVDTATRNTNQYVLAVLPLSNYDINEDSVKKNSKFVVNIGETLTERYNDFKSYSNKRNEATQYKSDVYLKIEDGKTRFEVKSNVWEKPTTLNFDQFITWLKERTTIQNANHNQ